MKTILFGVYAFDGNGAFLGYELTKKYVNLGHDLQTVVCTEYNLTNTGFAENSYQLVAIGNDEKDVALFVEKVRLEFENIVEKSFGEPFDKIDFDDNGLKSEFQSLMNYMKTKGEVKEIAENMYQIQLSK